MIRVNIPLCMALACIGMLLLHAVGALMLKYPGGVFGCLIATTIAGVFWEAYMADVAAGNIPDIRNPKRKY